MVTEKIDALAEARAISDPRWRSRSYPGNYRKIIAANVAGLSSS